MTSDICEVLYQKNCQDNYSQGKQVKQMNTWSSQIVPNLSSCENKSDKLSCVHILDDLSKKDMSSSHSDNMIELNHNK